MVHLGDVRIDTQLGSRVIRLRTAPLREQLGTTDAHAVALTRVQRSA